MRWPRVSVSVVDMVGTTIVVVALLFPGLVLAQISPGELSAAHEKLEGMRNCLKCHELGAGPSAKKCMECHDVIARKIKEQAGYHHHAVTVEERSCFECHNEHAGRDFRLIRWPEGMGEFDHSATGYVLSGKHAQTSCRKCHHASRVSAKFLSAHKDVNSASTFLGLGTACLDCHHDEHRKQLSTDCVSCHDHSGWKPAPGFDHGKAKFVLTGKHTKVACDKCHKQKKDGSKAKGADQSYAQYVGIEYRDCTSCHKDVHAGKFKQTCASCHRTDGWKNVDAAHFDHAQTGFALEGRHASLECRKCHGDGPKKKQRKKPQHCRDCHEDPHRAQFANLASKSECEACHTVNGFRPSTYRVADHNQGRFLLAGAHLAQACSACHVQVKDGKGPYQLFMMKNIACAACHPDVHRKQFQARFDNDCSKCHGAQSFQPATFTAVEHRKARFVLDGAHAKVACAKCHVAVEDGDGVYALYRIEAKDCASCHGTNNVAEIDGRRQR